MIRLLKHVFRRSGQVSEESKIDFEAVEPRVLFSATPVDPLESADGAHHSLPLVQEEASAHLPVRSEAPDVEIPAGVSGDGELMLDALNTYAPEMAAEGRREIVFISTDVNDYESIVSSLDPSYEVILINAESDGLAQMAAALDGIEDVDAIHLLTHGSEGRLFPGGTEVNAESIEGVHRSYLEAIRSALSEDADFLIYGCDFTAGEDGLATAELLSSVLGADVAASTNGTGHEDLGGDWDLETELGLIESEMLSLEGWDGLLAPISIVNTNNATTLANNIIGSGISLGTATYTGSAAQAGTFTSATGYTPEWLGYSSGIILTTGETAQVPGPNTNGGSSVNAPSAGSGADAGLTTLGGGTSFDASILDFTFTPTSNRVTMQFTFGSDEYNEYVYSNFNDAMGVWVNGVQVALTPTGAPISVNSVNRAGTFNPSQGNQANDPNPANGVFDSSNPNLYLNNEPGSAAYNTGMDGFTVTLSFVANVNIGVSNSIRIGIADIGDEMWDSWLFVREDSLTATTIAATDNVATAVNTPVVINALANDWDANGDPLTITHVLDKPITAGGPAVVLPSGSSVVLNLNGTLTFTPATGSTTDEVFTYTISDGTGSTAVGFINVDINQTPVNTVPSAQTTTEETSRTITGLSVADVDSTTLTTTLSLPAGSGTITVVTGGGAAISGNGSGSVIISGTAAQINAAIGSIAYAPTADFNTGSPAVPIALTIATTDGVSTDTDTVALTVTPVADIVADAISTTEDTARVFNAILGTNGASADNFENGGRVVSAVTQGANGSVTFLANGQITYTPNANFFGTDSFTYTVTSGGVTETATVTVNVSAVNDAPVNTVPAAQVATEDTNRIITGVSIADVDSTSLTTTLSIPVANGTLSVLTGGGATITGNGSATVTVSGTAAQINAAIASITYVPLADFNTATSFNLTVATSDGSITDTDTVGITVNAVSDIVADTVATNEETAVTFNAITGTNGASVDNFENGGRAVTSVTQGANGSVTFLANGQITYTPNTNFFGTDSFTYTVTSGGVTETATVTVNVAAVNDAPVNTVPAAQVATEDTNRIITGVSVADVDGTSLTTTLSIPGTTGTLSVLTGGGATITGNGTATVTVSGTAAQINAAIASITYVPLADFNTATSFNLTVATSDGSITDTDTVGITVNAVSDIVADTVATNEDTAVVFNAITGTNGASADNFENGGRAITSVTQGANGSVTFLANGQITYTPNANFFGTDTFSYTVTSAGVTETATVTVNVAAVNDAPVNTLPAAQVATEDTNRIITGVSIADVDSTSLTTTLSIPGTTGTLSVLTGGGATITGNGTATVVVSGTAAQINAAIASITYAPLADFNTATSFNLTVATSDGTVTDTDTVGLTVNAVADIVADSVATNEDTAVIFNAIAGTNGASADNFENGGRAITSVTQGANGSVTFLANGQITYTPNTNFFGSDSFTYTVTSGGVTETATVTVNVAAMNDAPDAVDDDFAAGENDGPVVLGNAITSNDSDIDGDDLVAVVQTGVAGSAGGVFSIDEDGVVTFDANGEFEDLAVGETRETTFIYTIEDGEGGTDTATVTVTVSGANDAPVVTGLIGTQWNEDSESVSIDLSGFFSDADSSDDLTYTATGLPAGLSLDPDTGLLSGTIASSASAGGPYSVEVTVNDGNGGIISQTFTWNVFNPAPVAANDDFAAGEDDGAAVVGNVLINDGDPDIDALSAQVASGGGSNGGQFTIAANGAVTFDADGDFDDLAVGETRETTFTYTLVDADGATSTAVITVTVTGANDAPLVIAGNTDRTDADSAVISLDTSVYFDDIDGSDVLTYTATGLPDGLSIDSATGIISGTIASSASVGGPYSIEVTAEDGSGATVMHAFVWTVTNPAPIAVADEFTADEDDVAAVVGNALANDSDPDGDSYSAQVATGIAGSNGGVFSIAANGDVTFDPAGAFNSLEAGETAVTSFTYTLIDADGATTTATFTVEVTGENDAPVAVGTIATQSSTDAEVIAGLDLSGFFTDPDSGDVLTYSASGLPAGLTIDSATGVISGAIGASASVGGPYTVIVTATDENGALVTQSFSWQISNPGPLAENDDFTADEDDAAAVVGNAILNNDSDPDGDALAAVVQSGVAGTQGGLFSIAANGTVTFNTNGEFEDLAAGETRETSFTYTLVDADGATSTATVTVTVTGQNDAPVVFGTIPTQSSDDSDVISLDTSGFFADADSSDVASFSASGLPAGLTIDEDTGVISGTVDSSASASGPYSVAVTMSDGNGGSVTQNFTWNVSNPGPIANDDAFTALEDDAATVVGNAITNNDSDPDGDALTAVVQTGVTGTSGGLFSIAADGQVTFDPNGAFEDLGAGETRETSFTYTLVDVDGALSTATVTVTVTGANDSPVTVGTIAVQNSVDSATISLDVSSAFSDPDLTDTLVYSVTGLPAGLTIDSGTGIISGTIDSSASVGGPYDIEVTVADGNGGTTMQSFVWNVTNPGPVALNDEFSAGEDDAAGVVGNAITNNDSDADGDLLSAIAQTVTGTQGGTFSIAANGEVRFDPAGAFEDLAAGETRATSFTYTLVDADGATSTATVTVTVAGANDGPLTSGTIPTQTNDDADSVSLDVSGSFSDPDGSDILTYTASGLPAGLTINANTGIISGMIDASASVDGPYSVEVIANDGNGGTVSQFFTWVVNNPAPIAVDDAFTVNEDDASAVIGNVITASDSDPDGDTISTAVQSGVAGSAGGLFSISGTGEVTFDPNGAFEDLAEGESRETTFTYTLVDADGATSTAVVTVTVEGSNDTPVTVGTIPTQDNDDSAVVSLDVSGFFADTDTNDVLEFSATGLPDGLSIDSATGIISGTIDSSASTGGPHTVVVTADDGNGGTTTQTFTWNVSNPGPLAEDDGFASGESTSGVVGNALGNDSDPDNDDFTALVATGVAGTNGGLFSIAANGEVSFDPNGEFEDLAVGEPRTTSFTYTLVDADGATSTATVTVTVTGENDVPVTVGTTADLSNDDSDVVTLDLSGYFTDADGSDILTYTATGLPAGLSIDEDTGIISGTIDSSASVGGPYTVVVIANDGNGGTVSQTFTWTVNNPAPVAVDDAFAAGEDDAAAVLGNVISGSDSDPDGDTIVVTSQSGVAGSNGGLFSVTANGDVSFDPNGQFEDLAAGETRTTSFTYTLVDADGASDTATVTVTGTGVNDAPVTVGTIAAQSNADSDSVALDVSGLFADTDATDVLEFSATGLPAGLTIDSATGLISGTIASSASAGSPYTVEIAVSDGKGGSVSQNFTWTVSNPAPLAVDDFFTAVADDNAAIVGNVISASDSDPDGDTIAVTAVTSVAGSNGGLFSIAANGDLTFDPNGQFDDLAVGETRTTTLTYTLVDADGETDTALVTVTVTGVNEAPVANGIIADQSHEDSEAITQLDVSGYFSDVDSSDTLTFSVSGLPDGLVIDANTGVISGTLDSSASAGSPHTVVVTANDGNGGTASHTFTWVVTNLGPVAVDDAFGAFEDDNAIIVGNAITSGDSDPDGDTLSALVLNNVAGSNGGLFSIAANGEVTFDANGDFESLAAGETVQTSFTYTLIDADGATATATIVVTVTGNNDAPFTVGTIADQANDDSDTVSVDVSGFFGDTDGSDVFAFSATDLPAGLVIDEATGVISGRIDSSASAGGPYTVVVTATDNSGSSTSQSFTWNVSNPGPVADDDSFAADEGDSAAVVGNVLVNDSDADGDALSVVAASGVAGSNGGIFSVSSTGEVTFDPNGAFESLALGETAVSTFTYTLVDADGATSTATVTVTITGLNDAPDRVGSIAAQTSADSDSVLLDVSGSFSDADATDELEFSATGLPAGLVIDAVTGVISGTIASSASASGPYTVIVTATDGQGAAITQTFSWTVTNPAPIAGDDFFNATEDDAAAIVGNALTNNDSDPDSDALEVVVLNNVAGSDGGLFSIAANGEVTFDPNGQFGDLAADEIRQTSFTYTLVDADGATSTATVTVDVAGANDAPVTVGTITTQNSLDSDVISLGTAGFFSDPDTTDVLTYSATGLPVGLTIDAATGVISGTIDSSASASGPYTVEVTATDEDGSAITQTFTWNVTNPGPVANDDNFTAVENVVGTVGNVITNNDTDPDDDALSVVAQIGVSGSDGGIFSIAANGEVSFDPNGEFDDLAFGESRTTSLTYTLVDADGATSTATVTITVNGANSAPFTVGTVPTQNNDDDDSVSLDLSGYFDDLDGSDVLAFSATGLPGGLTIDAATGVISGTIDSSASAAGPYTVEVTVIDGNGGTVSLNFTWNVTNPAPVAVDDVFVADEDDSTAVVGNVIVGSDSDPDGDSLAVQVVNLVAGSEGGLFSIAANGDVTFDPNGEFEDLAAGETRETSLTYTLVDADGATSTATVTITVTGANDAPVTVGTVAAQSSIDGETIAPINLAVHFDDVDHGAVLSYSASGLPTGLVIDSVTGVISGTINSSASQDGPFNVIITASDGLGGSVTQSFVWTVTNPGPVANDDAFTALEDSGLTVVGNAITNNDSDPDNDALSAVAGTNIAGSEGGLFSIAANGEVSFDPNGEFEDLADGETRETSFTYTLVDADGATTTATVIVTVTGANDAPVPVGSITTQSSVDSAVISLATSAFFADADASDVPSYLATGLPTGLVIDGTTGVISGMINSSASVAGPYTVVVTMADGNGGSTTQTFSWIVSNPAPLAQDDTFTTLEDDAAAVVGNAITNNDSDPDNDALIAVAATGVAGSDGGLFSINAAGEVSFDANGDFEDLAAGETRTTTFTYTVVDADGASAQATVRVEVTGENDAPENVGVIGTQVSVDSDVVTLDVSGFFSDKDLSDTLSYTATGLPAGLVIDAATGIISGTIDSSASQDGPFSVSVTAADGEGGSVTQTFIWTVSNPTPIANDDAFGVSEDDSLAVIGNVITAGDSDPDGDNLSVVAGSNIAGSHGGLFSIAANGDVSFDPNGAFEDLATGETRTTSFTYTLVDADGATATATVTVTVTGMNDAPTGVGSIATRSNADSDVIAPLDVTGFFADADLTDVMEYSATGLPSGLTIDAATGIISGTIASSASTGGPYSVTVTASDGNGGSVEQMFTWLVSNPAPDAVNDTYGIGEDDAATVLGNVIGNDVDPDGDALSVVAVSGAAGSAGGLFTISGTGEVSFNPNGAFEDLAAGETRETSYTYTLVDADGATSQTTVTVTVTGANDAPVRIGSVPAQVSEDSDAVTLNVSGAFGDMDASDVLRYSASGLPAGLSINEETGVISGTIDSSASASGPYTVVVTVDDNHGGTTTQTFTWTVTNPGPVAVDDSFVADEDDAAAIVGNAITGSDSDPDSDAVSAQVQSGVAGSHGGLFSIAANGDVTFDPNGAFEDLAAGETRETSFVYTLTDADGATTSATVTVTVTGENDAPVGNGSIATRNSIDGEIISLDLSGFFSDPDVSDVLSYSATGLPSGLSIDPVTGIISGTIDTSASVDGPYAALVTAQDASGMFVSLSFTWNVTNPVPVAQGDAFAAGEDDASLVVGNVLGNDSDPDDDTLTVVPVNQLAGSTGGLFTFDAAGNVTFSPGGDFEDLAAGETRETSVSYTLVDADGATVTATITVTVTGANDAPVVTLVLPNQSHQDSELIVPINTSVAFADADAGDSIVYSVTGLPAGLVFDIHTGIISGTLHSSASLGGPYLVNVTATDESGESVTASFTWTVTNPAPVANNDQTSGGSGDAGFGAAGNDQFSARENDLIAIVGNALDNDLDPDGDEISAVAESNIPGSHGGVFSIATNGEVTFDPAGQFEDLAVGETRETSFTYTIVDIDGGTATAVVTVTVTGSNDAPVVTSLISDQDDADGTPVSVDASVFFSDPDLSDTLRFSATGLPSGLTIDEETGVISGTIDHDASGDGPFTVVITATDENGEEITLSFVWTVTNPAPVAVNDLFNVSGTAATVALGNVIAGGDSDPDGDVLSVVPQSDVAGSGGGLFHVDADGNVTFDPNGAFANLLGGQSRETSFTYTLIDADGATSTATVTVKVTAANAPPVPQSEVITVDAGTRGESLGLRAPVDPDGDVVTITVTKLPKKGVLRLPNGKAVSRGQVLSASQLENLVFDAPEDYKGKKPVIFRYKVTDGQVTNHAKVRIKILKGELWVTCYSVTQKK